VDLEKDGGGVIVVVTPVVLAPDLVDMLLVLACDVVVNFSVLRLESLQELLAKLEE